MGDTPVPSCPVPAQSLTPRGTPPFVLLPQSQRGQPAPRPGGRSGAFLLLLLLGGRPRRGAQSRPVLRASRVRDGHAAAGGPAAPADPAPPPLPPARGCPPAPRQRRGRPGRVSLYLKCHFVMCIVVLAASSSEFRAQTGERSVSYTLGSFLPERLRKQTAKSCVEGVGR